MKKALNKSEVLKFATSITPEAIKIKLVQRDSLLSLHLIWKDFSGIIDSGHIIWQNFTNEKLDHEVYHLIMDEIKKEVRKVILKFGKDQCDFLIERFGLSEVYKQTYEDKNIMYKVKQDYLRKLDDKRSVIRNLSFHYYDEIKVSLPNLYYFWILLMTKKFSHSNFEGIFDITYSIMERIKQLFFTYSIIEDIIKGAKHYGNPDTFFGFLYHFSYFV